MGPLVLLLAHGDAGAEVGRRSLDSRVYRKLDVRSRTELAARGITGGRTIGADEPADP